MNEARYEKFFIALQRINQAAADADSADDLISAVLNEILEIFQCDRAWLLYPCDPDTPSWQVMMERTRPEWPGGLEMNVEFPTKPDDAAIFRALLDSGHTLKYDACNVIETEFAVQFSIKAQLLMAIRPKMDKAWVFGIHHCAHPHVYTEAEVYLFENIGKRIAEALNHFLAMRQLRESERYNRMLFENSPIGLALYHKSGSLLEVNPAFAGMLGSNPEEAKGLIFGQALPDGIARQGWGADEYHGKTGKPSSCEGELIHKEGYRVPVQISSNLIERNGECYILSCVENITERKQIEEAKRRESEVCFRGTLEQLAVGIAHASLDGHFQRINQKFCAIVGYARDELLDMNFHDITFPDDLDENIRYMQQLIAGEISTFSMEKRYVRKDRSLVWVNLTVSLLRDSDGAPKYTIGVIEDITGRKQSEALLQQFGSLLQGSFNEIYIFDACSLNFLLTSEGAERNLGYSSDELNQLIPPDLMPSFTREAFERLISTLRAGEQQLLFFEAFQRRKDGSTYPVEVRLQFMDSDFPVFVSIIQDITERKCSERQLRDLTAHIQTVREEEKAGIAREIHDNLGSTLTALKMDIYWLADELSANKEAAPLLEHIESMSQLLDNAVEVTRSVITDLRPTILDDLGLQAALEWQAEQFHKRTGIQCMVACICIGDCKNELDKMQTINLFRIFQESLTNVARHSGASRVEVELRCEDEEVVLTISDNGCGLPAGHIIAPTSYGMLGMRERAEQLGGRAEFYSPPGGGFSVTVILPQFTDSKRGVEA